MQKYIQLSLLILPILFLPGCKALDWIKEKLGMSTPQATYVDTEKKTINEVQDGSEVLVTVNDQPRITRDMLREELEQLLQENPQLQQLLAVMPDMEKNLLKGMVSQLVVDEWAVKNNIGTQEEFKKEFERMVKQIKRMLNAKFFNKEHPAQVTAEEVKAFYNEHKDMIPDLIVSRGGVNAVALQFDNKDDASAFLQKAKSGKLEQVASQDGKSDQLREFSGVSQYSRDVPTAIRQVLIEMKSFPSTELVESDGSFWVVQGTSKQETKYAPFSDVKEALRPAVEERKQAEHMEKVIDGYKGQFGVEVNEDAVQSSQPEMPDGFSGGLGEMPEDEEPEAPARAA